MHNALPPDGTCPTCNGSFHLQARTLYQSLTSGAHDKLEWTCALCGRSEVEHRDAIDGVADVWPASRFQRS